MEAGRSRRPVAADPRVDRSGNRAGSPGVSGLEQVPLEHLALYSLMLASAGLVFRFGAKAVPVALAASLGVILSRAAPRWIGFVLAAWCALTFSVGVESLRIAWTEAVYVVPLAIQAATAWLWWSAGRRAPTLPAWPSLEQWLALGSAALLVLLAREPSGGAAATAFVVAASVLLRVPLLTAVWRSGRRPALPPSAVGTWLLGWFLSLALCLFLFPGSTGPTEVTLDFPRPPVTPEIFFLLAALILGASYRTLAAELRAQRPAGAVLGASFTLVAEILVIGSACWL